LAKRLELASSQHSAARDMLGRFWNRGRGALATTLIDFSRARSRRMAGAR
jgi:hypothetical protein